MPLAVNLRHLEAHPVRLQGELPLAELDLDPKDEVIRPQGPLGYDIEVQKLEGGLWVQGRLSLELECECVRCLKLFRYKLQLEDWGSHLPLQGEDAVPVVNDCVDLTPNLREDILLEFPQHPVCEPGCRGLADTLVGKAKTSSPGQTDSSAWAALNKLKFNK